MVMAEGTVLNKHNHHCGVGFVPSLCSWSPDIEMMLWLCTTKGRVACAAAGIRGGCGQIAQLCSNTGLGGELC